MVTEVPWDPDLILGLHEGKNRLSPPKIYVKHQDHKALKLLQDYLRKTVIKGIFHSWWWGHYLLFIFISSSIFCQSLKHTRHYLFSQHLLSLSFLLFLLKICVYRIENNSYYSMCGFCLMAGSCTEGPPWMSPVERQPLSRLCWRATPVAPVGRRAADASHFQRL